MVLVNILSIAAHWQTAEESGTTAFRLAIVTCHLMSTPMIHAAAASSSTYSQASWVHNSLQALILQAHLQLGRIDRFSPSVTSRSRSH